MEGEQGKGERKDRLDSWGEIAKYLGWSERTLMRWEQRGLPVHRVPGGGRQPVFAYRHELDDWLRSGARSGNRDQGLENRDSGFGDRRSGANPPIAERGQGSTISDEGAASSAPTGRDSGSVAETNSPPATAANDGPSSPDGAASRTPADGVQEISPNGAQHEAITTSPGVLGSSGWPGRRDAGATGAASSAPTGRDASRAPTSQSSGFGIRDRWIWKVAAFAALVVSIFLGLHFIRRPSSSSPMQWSQVTHDGYEKPREFPLLTDGPQLYLEESAGTRRVIASVPASGGDASIVSAPGALDLSDVSPDGATLLLFGELPGENERRLWTSPATGGPIDSLRGLVGSQGAWSPDGSRLVFARGNALYIAAGDGRGKRKLTDTGYRPYWLRWSPDGKTIRFTVAEPRAQLEAIWQVSADGKNSHQFLADWSKGKDVCCGNWTADGKYFVFQATVNDSTDIWTVLENRSFFIPESNKPVQITAGPMNYYSPLPSRDGKRLFVIGERPRAQLMELDMRSRHFIEFLSGISATDVSFSRDGKWLAYITYPQYQLWRSRADGSDARQLTFGKMTVDDPEWSPDGKQIAFLGVTDGPHYKAYVVPADGGAVWPFIPGLSEEGVASWSSDGKSIVFGGLLHRKPNSQMAIHLLNVGTHRLTSVPGSEGLWTARWSPDGHYIAALSCEDEKHLSPSLWLYNLRTRKWTLMARVNWINDPSWSGDSRYMYFGTPEDPTDPALYRVRVRDRKLERLADLKPNAEGENWTGVTPDGSPLISRNAASQEVYAFDWRLGH